MFQIDKSWIGIDIYSFSFIHSRLYTWVHCMLFYRYACSLDATRMFSLSSRLSAYSDSITQLKGWTRLIEFFNFGQSCGHENKQNLTATRYSLVQVMLLCDHVCRCHCDGEAQCQVERCCRTRRSQGGPEGSRNPSDQIPTPLHR